MPSRANEIVEVESEGKTKKFRIVELPIDPPLTVRRVLVPADTEEDDIPVGSRMLDERESAGFLARQARPDNILVGDLVRKRLTTEELANGVDNTVSGTVEGKLKTGKFRVKWDNGEMGRYEAKELMKVW